MFYTAARLSSQARGVASAGVGVEGGKDDNDDIDDIIEARCFVCFLNMCDVSLFS